MFKHFLAAVAILLLSSPTFAADPIVSKQFELDKHFCLVTKDVMQSGDKILKALKMELIECEFEEGTLVLSRKGWSVIVDRKLVADIKPSGRINLVEKMEISKNSILVEQELDGKDRYFKVFKFNMEFVKDGNKTKVRTNFWVRLHRHHHIFVRAVVYGNARRLEAAIREATQCPPPEKPHENAPADA